jgi:hypothetical protein
VVAGFHALVGLAHLGHGQRLVHRDLESAGLQSGRGPGSCFVYKGNAPLQGK